MAPQFVAFPEFLSNGCQRTDIFVGKHNVLRGSGRLNNLEKLWRHSS